MTRVMLLHGGRVPHYRIPIYNHLSIHLAARGFKLSVVSQGIQHDSPTPLICEYDEVSPSATRIVTLVRRRNIDVVIMFVDLRHQFLFPVYTGLKLLGVRLVWWGQGRDLAAPDAILKNAAYALEHRLCDAIILYAEHLRRYVSPRHHRKLFIANNTLALPARPASPIDRRSVLAAYGVTTQKNVICMGRFQRRKRIDRLVDAVRRMARDDVGVILVGPDTEGVLGSINGPNVFKLGAIYGDAKYELLAAADVYCLPGAVGLSIVDAFHCGLPFVTEEGDESAELCYLKDGENGFLVPCGDIQALAARLQLLLDDDALRRSFSQAARQEIEKNGSIEGMCAGFTRALEFATQSRARLAGVPDL